MKSDKTGKWIILAAAGVVLLLTALSSSAAVEKVIILNPKDGAVFSVGEKIKFEGRGINSQMRPILGDKLVWESDGQLIGKGSTFEMVLGFGFHAVTLTAIDSDGTSLTEQVTIKVQ